MQVLPSTHGTVGQEKMTLYADAAVSSVMRSFLSNPRVSCVLAAPRKIQSEKAMATHSSALAWKIPWMEEPGGLQSMGSLGVGHD